MASFTFSSAADTWPVGTSVGAYLPGTVAGSLVSGSALTTATVASDGSLTFVGLADDAAYVAYDGTKARHFRTASAVDIVEAVVLAVSGSTIDAAPLIQAAFDDGARTITLPKPPIGGGVALLDSPVFFDVDNIRDRITLDLNGWTVQGGANLPTSDQFTPDTAVQFAFFPNTLRSAYNSSTKKVAVTSGNRVMGVSISSVQQPDPSGYFTVINGVFDGQGEKRALMFCNDASGRARRVTLYRGYCLVTWTDYADSSGIDECGGRSPIVGVSSLVKQFTSGDGIEHKGHCDARMYQADLAGNQGFISRASVGGRYRLTRCFGAKIIAWHGENDTTYGDASTPHGLTLDRTQVALDSCVLWNPKTAGLYNIEINDSASSTEMATELLVKDSRLLTYLRGTATDGTDPLASPSVHITRLNDSGVVRFENTFGGLGVAGLSPVYPAGALIKSDDSTIQTAIDAGQAIIATGNWELRKNKGSWEIVALAQRGMTTARKKISPTFTNVIVPTVPADSGATINGTLVSGHVYEYVTAMQDELGFFGPPSTISSTSRGTADSVGTLRGVLNSRGAGVLHIWRKDLTADSAANGAVATSPTAYVKIPVGRNTLRFYDTGANVNGWVWLTTSIPSVPASDNTVAAAALDGARLAFNDAVLLSAARDPESMFVGAVTVDSNGAYTSAPVVWPDGATGTYTGTASTAFPDAVDSYTITHVLQGVTTTYTQSTVTRDALTGKITNRPAITVA
jgi:hypothetical protein